MKLDEAKNNLMSVLIDGRITMPNGSLTGRELATLQQSVEVLFDSAKEKTEAKQEVK